MIKVIFFVCFFNLSWLWYLWLFLSDFIPCHLYLCFLYLRWIPFMITTLMIFFSSKILIYILLSMNAFLFIFSGMLFLWIYQSNKFMVISYNNAKTIQVNTIAHKIVPPCVVVAICLGTLIWQEVRHLTHSIRSSEFTRLCFKATHLVLLLLLH